MVALRRRRMGATLGLAASVVAVVGAVAAAHMVTREAAPQTPCRPSTDPQPAVDGTGPATLTRDSSRVRPFAYVIGDRVIGVFDVEDGHRLVQRITVPQLVDPRGAMVGIPQARLFIPCGGHGEPGQAGTILALDLLRDRLVWARRYETGVDSGAVTPDGKVLYSPVGVHSTSTRWNVVNAADGEVIGAIEAGSGPHNTIVSADGRFVFLAGRKSPYLAVADTRTNRVIRRIGPLVSGGRPFTVDASVRTAYTTMNDVVGFQVSDVQTGKVIRTVRASVRQPAPGTLGADRTPSHGIALAPDGRRLYLIDTVHAQVHVFDTAGPRARAPRQVASIRVRPVAGEGWLQMSRDGRFLYVAGAGDVIDTRALETVARLPLLRRTKTSIEIGWRRGVPVETSTHYAVGRTG